MLNHRSSYRMIAGLRARLDALLAFAERTLVWRVWERMVQIEFIDRSVALAGKAFVSFFPLVIVVAAFMPDGIRRSILSSVTNRMGVRGDALDTVQEAFATTDDIRRATGLLGLLLTFLFASSFTTALRRVYLRTWRRENGSATSFARGPAWLAIMLVYMAVLGGARVLVGDGAGVPLFVVFSVVAGSAAWWFTAWFLLEGQVRSRVLVPTGVITGVVMGGYAISAIVWMPDVIARNADQFGFFGVALALVTWFSGAAMCILVGSCAGVVLAEDDGWIGGLVRGETDDLLTEGAPPSLPAPPPTPTRIRDVFRPTEEEIEERGA